MVIDTFTVKFCIISDTSVIIDEALEDSHSYFFLFFTGYRLTGERGIPILPNVFKDVKFKGKGHEVSLFFM